MRYALSAFFHEAGKTGDKVRSSQHTVRREKGERPERWLNVILASAALGETMWDNALFDFKKLFQGVFRWQSFR